MEPQLFELINERSDRQDKALEEIKQLVREHTQKDERYWRKIDVQEGQLRLLKWMFGSTVASAIGGLYAWMTSLLKG